MYHPKVINRSTVQIKCFNTCVTALVLLLFCLQAYAQPANDECTGATVITAIPFTDMVNTTTATSNPEDPSLSCNYDGARTDGNTVWYVWTPQDNVTVELSTDGSDYDTAHGIFTGDCGDLVALDCVDYGITDVLTFSAEANETYYIKVGEFFDGAGGGNLVFTVVEKEPIVLTSVRDGISPPLGGLLKSLAKPAKGSGTVEEVPMYMRENDKSKVPGNEGMMNDAAGHESDMVREFSSDNMQLAKRSSKIEVLQVIDGAENDDNDNIVGFLLYPPDTDGDVGLNHYVQMTNLVTTIFDKSGNTVLGPFAGNIFWSGLGGLCEETNNGDVIVLYDEETDRWLVSQFAFNSSGSPPWSLCIACSETGDPTGSYYQHEFSFSGIGFPDYPKYGFVTNAIGVMANIFSPYQGAGLGAINKAEAFSSGPATMLFYKMGTNEWGYVVGDNDGPVFDNMPPTFATNNGGSGSRIDFWEIQPDFAVPSNSTIYEVARIPVSPFDTDLCTAPRERCIDQPEDAPRLEAISDRLMHRLQLRNYGNDIRAVVTHTVDVDGFGLAGKRWYEFRNHKDRGWKLFKENTVSPNSDHRWMGSIAMNTLGETCLGYSISSSTTYTSIGVSGRRGEASFMNLGEKVVYDGNPAQYVQLGSGARWGDYSAMAVDPVDGTFWYTQEYAKPNTRLGELAGWATKIFQIRFKGGDEKLKKDIADNMLPESYSLAQNEPNPFNPATEIRFQLPEAGRVTVKIFNSLGQEIRQLADRHYEAGNHTISWDSRDDHGKAVASGTYFYELQAGEFKQVKKMSLVK